MILSAAIPSYSDPVVDYIVYCELDFYGVAEDDDDACDNTDKRTYLGSIKGYLILTHLMELMGESAYHIRYAPITAESLKR